MGIESPDKIQIGTDSDIGLTITKDTITHPTMVQPIIQVNTVLNQVEMPQKMKLKELEIQSFGLNSYGRGKFTGNDIEIADANKGLILTANNLTKWLLWVDNAGSTFTTQIAASPEISIAERETKINTQQTDYKTLKTQLALIASTNLKGRIDVLEQIIKLILK